MYTGGDPPEQNPNQVYNNIHENLMIQTPPFSLIYIQLAKNQTGWPTLHTVHPGGINSSCSVNNVAHAHVHVYLLSTTYYSTRPYQLAGQENRSLAVFLTRLVNTRSQVQNLLPL